MVVLISVVLLGRWRALKDGGRWLSRMEENEVEQGGGGGERRRRRRRKEEEEKEEEENEEVEEKG